MNRRTFGRRVLGFLGLLALPKVATAAPSPGIDWPAIMSAIGTKAKVCGVEFILSSVSASRLPATGKWKIKGVFLPDVVSPCSWKEIFDRLGYAYPFLTHVHVVDAPEFKVTP
jgi:hypothetical protein